MRNILAGAIIGFCFGFMLKLSTLDVDTERPMEPTPTPKVKFRPQPDGPPAADEMKVIRI